MPKYQRSYAWEKQNVRDLFEDIQEAQATDSNHYIGTVVLAKTEKRGTFNVVDGQQRLTTVVMFISVIISFLPEEKDKEYFTRYYIGLPGSYKLLPLERDRAFYIEILCGNVVSSPESKSQRFMLDAYEEMKNILEDHVENPKSLLEAIGALSVLEFIEEKESDAIRIFQTVNDRGRDLSRMDKMKSLLFYFSNKYLSGKYDDRINDRFGEIFELYDDIKLAGEDQKINIISSKQFNEDDLLRHHHICFSEESYDPTGQQVLENVKTSLNSFRKEERFSALDAYIEKYIESLRDYVSAFRRVILRTNDDAEYYKLFSILGLSAVYYPVITQLEIKSLLQEKLPKKGVTVLQMIEIIDVRVLKIRDYAGKRHIAGFAFKLNNQALDIEEIEKHLTWFNSHEISNDRFKDYLSQYDYFKNTGLLRTLFIDHCENLRKKNYTIQELKKIMAEDPSIEHILSQTPKFKPRSFGFKNDEEFENYKNLIGNLTLLEKKINSSIKNLDLVEKHAGYSKSKFKMTTSLGTMLATNGGNFKKNEMVARSEELVNEFAHRWWA